MIVPQFSSWHLLRSKCASLHPANHSLRAYHAGGFTSRMPSFQSLTLVYHQSTPGPPTIYSPSICLPISSSVHRLPPHPSIHPLSDHCLSIRPSIICLLIHTSTIHTPSIHQLPTCPFIYYPKSTIHL